MCYIIIRWYYVNSECFINNCYFELMKLWYIKYENDNIVSKCVDIRNYDRYLF